MTVTSASGHGGLLKGLMKIKMVWILCYCLHSHQISTLFGKHGVRQDSPPLPSKNQMRNIYRNILLSWSQFHILGFTALSHDQGIPVYFVLCGNSFFFGRVWELDGFLHTWSAALHVACSISERRVQQIIARLSSPLRCPPAVSWTQLKRSVISSLLSWKFPNAFRNQKIVPSYPLPPAHSLPNSPVPWIVVWTLPSWLWKYHSKSKAEDFDCLLWDSFTTTRLHSLSPPQIAQFTPFFVRASFVFVGFLDS